MTDEPAGITFYWRPGCGFCARLERALVKAGALTIELSLERSSSAASGLANAPTWRYRPEAAGEAFFFTTICTGTTAAACCSGGGVYCSIGWLAATATGCATAGAG